MAVKVEPLDLTAPGIVVSTILAESSCVPNDTVLVSIGDAITVEGGGSFLRGHGTMMVEDEDEPRLIATTCGIVQRLNKLIMVRAYKCRYLPEIGDVVVGRVTEIQTRRWVVDIGARPHCSLQLSAVQLPGGIQRRRTAQDELNMRQVFKEGDVIAAEVQQTHRHDNSVALHMRSGKYRKLNRGQLAVVPSQLIRRQTSHFVDVDGQGIQLVIGCNGWIWVGVSDMAAAPRKQAMHSFTAADEGPEDADFAVSPEQWDLCARYARAASGLAELSLPVFRASLEETVAYSLAQQTSCTDMLGMDFLTAVVSLERRRRDAMDTGE